jgi:glutathione S-transferase
MPGTTTMKMHMFPPSSRVTAIVALKFHFSLDWETVVVDLGRGDQQVPSYLLLNPNQKMPTLEDDGLVLWESNAILVYLASKRPESGMWPSGLKEQADVLRWLFWECAHWDTESIGMVVYEKRSKGVLGLGAPDPAFIARGEQNFARFAAVLNDWLRGKAWLVGERLTIADFSIGGLVPPAQTLGLPLVKYSEVVRWYEGLTSLPAWNQALAARQAAATSWIANLDRRS